MAVGSCDRTASESPRRGGDSEARLGEMLTHSSQGQGENTERKRVQAAADRITADMRKHLQTGSDRQKSDFCSWDFQAAEPLQPWRSLSSREAVLSCHKSCECPSPPPAPLSQLLGALAASAPHPIPPLHLGHSQLMTAWGHKRITLA